MIKGIIFDLGNTLLRFTGDWETVTRAGAEAMATWYFKSKRIKIDGPALVDTFLSERAAAIRQANETQAEVLAQASLQNALEKIDAPARTKAMIEAALKIYFEQEEEFWQPYDDTVETIKQLYRQGYRLGLYSNATDDPLIRRLINRNHLRPWLSPTFSSAGCGWRKPKREPFDLIAGRWGLPPDQIVMVGDTLEADILGAQNAGMPGILVTMDEAPSNAENRHIQPAAIAERLSDIPEIIKQL
ncbi:MAG TPA: HAD family hydrolase [Anaerolineae bacterium]